MVNDSQSFVYAGWQTKQFYNNSDNVTLVKQSKDW